jgi:hypothetical protein
MWCDIIGYVAAVKPPLSSMCCVHASGWLCKQLGQDKISPADAAASICNFRLLWVWAGCYRQVPSGASLVSDETVWPCMLRSIFFLKKNLMNRRIWSHRSSVCFMLGFLALYLFLLGNKGGWAIKRHTLQQVDRLERGTKSREPIFYYWSERGCMSCWIR